MADDIQVLKQELDALRRTLKAPYDKAKAAGDQAEMERLVDIAKDIDEKLRLVALGVLGNLAESVEKIRAKIENREDEVYDFSSTTLDDLQERVRKVLKLSAEEALADATAVAPAEPIVDSTVRADAPVSEGAGKLILTEAYLIALWRRCQFPIDDSRITVFGFRGCRPVDFSGTGFLAEHEITMCPVDYKTMNCTIGQWYPGKGIALFPGSTVPFGRVVSSRIASNGMGVNQMGRGRYKRYRAGWHKRSEGSNGHWALQQDCAITIQRTSDDADFDLLDRWDVGRIAGDNIHCAFHMGLDGNPADAGFSSAGCQTIAGTVKKGQRSSEVGPWKRFIEPFADTLGKQDTTEYVLLSGDELQLMIRTRCRGRTVLLRMGSAGPLVKNLQAALNARLDAGLTIDGDFGPSTFEAVTAFQSTRFGPEADDGIVGAATAEALGFTLPEFDFDNAVGGGPGYDGPPIDSINAGGSEIGGDLPVAKLSPGDEIAFGLITRKKHGQAFNDRVIDIAARLGCDPNHLMAIMAFETGESFAPDRRNDAGSSATGLIQFTEATAKSLGTSTAALAKMTAIEQLEFVEKHFRSITMQPLQSLSDAYMAVLLPAAIGTPDSHVLFERGTKAYEQNAGLDKDKSGKITKAEAVGKVHDKLELGMKANRFG